MLKIYANPKSLQTVLFEALRLELNPYSGNRNIGALMRVFARIFLLLFLTTTNAGAEIVVLIHGFKSSGRDWYDSGVISHLQSHGWRPGGHYRYHPQSVMGPPSRAEGKDLFYTIDLPDTAPIMLQVAFLHAVLQSIEAIAPDETLNLVGHSAGGVVARAVMVTHPEHTIARLITIAAPHLGSYMASAGALVDSTPLSMMANMLGQDELVHAGQLLSELSPPAPGNFLFWLNQQAHPPALQYTSIVRADDSMLGGDFLISPQSQDLRNVVALGSRAVSYPTPGSHSLQAQDGDLINYLLRQP